MKNIQFFIDHFHLPQMRQMMFRAGGRAGISHHLHCQSGKDQRIHQFLASVSLSLGDLTQTGNNRPQRFLFQFHDPVANIFSCEKMSDLPVCQADVFSQQIGDSGSRQTRGSVRKNPGIGKNRHWRNCRNRFLESFPCHCRYI